MKKYFANCKNLEELKKEYRKLVMVNHPDNGGDTRVMAEIIKEYKQMFEVLKNEQNRKAKEDKTGKTYHTNETAEMFMEILEKIMFLDGLEIEICGSWVWVGGNTYAHKTELKNASFSYSAKKKMWYWKPYETTWFKGKKSYTMDEIRNTYGSEKVEIEKRLRIEA